MRYDEMAKLYPQVEELFAAVADMIRAGRPAENVLAFLEIRVGSEMRRHRQDVIGKLRQFAQVVEDNIAFSEAWRTDPEPVSPNLCPYCGSIEIAGGVCRWCVSGKKLKRRGIQMLSEAILRIENQRKEFKQDSNEDGVCQVILQYCREDQEVARVLASTDKTVKDCYKHMEEYARKHKVGSGYYMGPDTTRRVICQFYSIAGGNAAAASAAAPAPVVTKRDNAINILDLL